MSEEDDLFGGEEESEDEDFDFDSSFEEPEEDTEDLRDNL
jgi:hypothetical protein